jgi:hypothetical protein
MAKPPQTYMQGIRATKNAAVAKDSKVAVAVAQAASRANVVHGLLKKAAIDRRRLAEIKSLVEAVKKGEVGDPKRRLLLKAVDQLITVAKHGTELAHASATLAAPSQAFLRQAQQLGGATPNFAAALAPMLLFVIVLDKFLATKPRVPGQ